METARKILNRLRQSFTIPPDDATVCLCAALLHDLGHGPFSHVFERVTGIDHEHLTQRLIMDPDSEVHQILIARNGTYILENMNTASLVQDQAWEFMFVLGPSRITGGVQGIVNPTAIR
jgi:HD superfamily phosphohydrolase